MNMSTRADFVTERERFERSQNLVREAQYTRHRRRLDRADHVIVGAEFDRHRRMFWNYVRRLETRIADLEARR